ncbi:hypothetical protein [Nodosilinea sp. E11]|uniref:hypothetical protein n=1 Tax=Nodosilinea sp. E11 TaxID=3037479 RepID=UPI0029350892|nr:hypothetical protein [Nodosilinea sp. E11]WOD40013.1 hypothetical protein RRF56_04330 [Nodosilinea sp. E11]
MHRNRRHQPTRLRPAAVSTDGGASLAPLNAVGALTDHKLQTAKAKLLGTVDAAE